MAPFPGFPEPEGVLAQYCSGNEVLHPTKCLDACSEHPAFKGPDATKSLES